VAARSKAYVCSIDVHVRDASRQAWMDTPTINKTIAPESDAQSNRLNILKPKIHPKKKKAKVKMSTV
jgi:hypothetical protein